jgi:hypothetical protein
VQQATGIVAVFGVLMVVYYFLMGRRVGTGRVASDGGHLLSDDGFGGTVAAFFEGVIAVLAMSELASSGGARTGSFTGGALLGIVAAVGLLARRWWPGRLGYELLYGVLGLAASVPALTRVFDASDCDVGVDPSVRIVAVVILAVVWIGVLIAALTVKALSGWHTTASGLALFGALDVIVVMSGPIGAGLTAGSAVWIVLGAAVIGGLSGLATNLVMMTCGAFLGLLQFVTAATGYGAGCVTLVSSAPYALLVGYVVAFWIGAWLVSRRRTGRPGDDG